MQNSPTNVFTESAETPAALRPKLPDILADAPLYVRELLVSAGSTMGERAAKVEAAERGLQRFYDESAGDPLIDRKMTALYAHAQECGFSQIIFAFDKLLQIEFPKPALQY